MLLAAGGRERRPIDTRPGVMGRAANEPPNAPIRCVDEDGSDCDRIRKRSQPADIQRTVADGRTIFCSLMSDIGPRLGNNVEFIVSPPSFQTRTERPLQSLKLLSHQMQEWGPCHESSPRHQIPQGTTWLRPLQLSRQDLIEICPAGFEFASQNISLAVSTMPREIISLQVR